MKPGILKLVCITLSLSICLSAPAAHAKDTAIFAFHTDEFWLNLHHFLYVLGRAQNKERDTSREAVAAAPDDQERGLQTLSVTEQAIWREAVSSYAAGLSKKDLVFDDPLPALTNALAGAGDAKSLTEVKSIRLSRGFSSALGQYIERRGGRAITMQT